jgi:hypothetical protein
MSARWTTLLAWLLWLLTGLLVWITVGVGAWRDGLGWFSDDWLGTAFLVLHIVPATVGALLVSRFPRNAIGWVFCLAALASAGEFLFNVVHINDQVPVTAAGWQWYAWIIRLLLDTTALATITFLFLLFPTGRVPSPRWRPLLWLSVIFLVGIAINLAFGAELAWEEPDVVNPAQIELVSRLFDPLGFLGLVLLPAVLLGSLAALIARFRRARGVERQQLKWFVYVAGWIVASVVVILLLGPLGLSDTELNDFFVFFGAIIAPVIGVPVAVGIAILRYRLYDIDLIIRRTLIYGALTASLLLVYLALVVALSTALRDLTGASSQLVTAASTLAVAALFRPLRARIQAAVDHRFYRRKYDTARTLEAFSARLRDELDLDTLRGELHSVVHETMQPAHVSLWLRPDTGGNGALENSP